MAEKLVFETPSYRGIVIKAFWLDDPKADARLEIWREGQKIDELRYAAYKVFNVAAHHVEIIDGEFEGSGRGWFVAGSDLLGGMVLPTRVVNEGDDDERRRSEGAEEADRPRRDAGAGDPEPPTEQGAGRGRG